MNDEKEVLAKFLTTSVLLSGLLNDYPSQTREAKEHTIRKCADPKKKAKRKMVQASRRRNRG